MLSDPEDLDRTLVPIVICFDPLWGLASMQQRQGSHAAQDACFSLERVQNGVGGNESRSLKKQILCPFTWGSDETWS